MHHSEARVKAKPHGSLPMPEQRGRTHDGAEEHEQSPVSGEVLVDGDGVGRGDEAPALNS